MVDNYEINAEFTISCNEGRKTSSLRLGPLTDQMFTFAIQGLWEQHLFCVLYNVLRKAGERADIGIALNNLLLEITAESIEWIKRNPYDQTSNC